MSDDSRTLLVLGAGKVGGAVVDQLAMRYPRHRYVIVSRSLERSMRRANLSRYICSQWNRYPDVRGASTNLSDIDRTAELISRVQPEVIFNATTPFPWWLLDALPAQLRALTYEAGLGMWAALDCLLPLKLTQALSGVADDSVLVNACYPDMVNAFLRDNPRRPTTGIGNFSNVVPGLTLAFAEELGLRPESVKVRLICNHYTGLTAPSVGGHAGASYYLEVSYPGGRLTFEDPDDRPFALLTRHASRVRGLEGQGVTVNSAATVLATFLNRQRRRHHVPGPLGLVGGYPVEIGEGGAVSLDLPSGIDRARAEEINVKAQRHDGIEEVSPGRVVLTARAQEALMRITGFNAQTITEDNVETLADELLNRLNGRYDLKLHL